MIRFLSQEKAVVREALWAPALNQLLSSLRVVKVLEFLGDRDEYWLKVKQSNHGVNLIVDGVTLDPTTTSQVCRVIFRSPYNQLLQSAVFTQAFPYNLINLDYCGGGRWFEGQFRYAKYQEITQTIDTNLQCTDSFALLLTLDMADLIYPFYKAREDAIRDSLITDEILSFLDSLPDLDYRPTWMALIGNVLELQSFCQEKGYGLALQASPYTYIGKSDGHVTRMLSYALALTKEGGDPEKEQSRLWASVKQVVWVA